MSIGSYGVTYATERISRTRRIMTLAASPSKPPLLTAHQKPNHVKPKTKKQELGRYQGCPDAELPRAAVRADVDAQLRLPAEARELPVWVQFQPGHRDVTCRRDR